MLSNFYFATSWGYIYYIKCDLETLNVWKIGFNNWLLKDFQFSTFFCRFSSKKFLYNKVKKQRKYRSYCLVRVSQTVWPTVNQFTMLPNIYFFYIPEIIKKIHMIFKLYLTSRKTTNVHKSSNNHLFQSKSAIWPKAFITNHLRRKGRSG